MKKRRSLVKKQKDKDIIQFQDQNYEQNKKQLNQMLGFSPELAYLKEFQRNQQNQLNTFGNTSTVPPPHHTL